MITKHNFGFRISQNNEEEEKEEKGKADSRGRLSLQNTRWFQMHRTLGEQIWRRNFRLQSEGVFPYVERLQTEIANQKYNKFLAVTRKIALSFYIKLKGSMEFIHTSLLVCDYPQIWKTKTLSSRWIGDTYERYTHIPWAPSLGWVYLAQRLPIQRLQFQQPPK